MRRNFWKCAAISPLDNYSCRKLSGVKIPENCNWNTKLSSAISTRKMMTEKSQQILRWISSLIGAVSCWWMAYAIYRAYDSGQPQVFGIRIIALYLLEFILVH